MKMRPTAKARLTVRIWIRFVAVQLRFRRRPVPEYIATLGRPPRRPRAAVSPARLSRAVERSLRFGSWRPRCIVSSLVLYRLLREQGDAPKLVIGLPDQADGPEAHAWVELDGVDIGPAPGRAGHESLVSLG